LQRDDVSERWCLEAARPTKSSRKEREEKPTPRKPQRVLGEVT